MNPLAQGLTHTHTHTNPNALAAVHQSAAGVFALKHGGFGSFVAFIPSELPVTTRACARAVRWSSPRHGSLQDPEVFAEAWLGGEELV